MLTVWTAVARRSGRFPCRRIRSGGEPKGFQGAGSRIALSESGMAWRGKIHSRLSISHAWGIRLGALATS
jgi:hypothetical protein